MLKLIERELKLDEPSEEPSTLLTRLPTHVCAWLTINSMRMEQLQFFQLCLQNMHTVWRNKAFSNLLEDSLKPSPQALVRAVAASPSQRSVCAKAVRRLEGEVACN